MKALTRVSMLVTAIPFVAMLWSSAWLILLVQPERAEIAIGTVRGVVPYEASVHEAGFARLVISVIGLLIVFIPYRKGERWALAALGIILFAYVIPVFGFGAPPKLGTWQIFRGWEERVWGPETVMFLNYSVVILSVLGVVLALPRFVGGRPEAVG
jgi:hypothetical protein